MTSLKDINFGINQYCGPAILSALTGRSTDECAAVISQINGKKEIKAVEVQHLIKAFEKLRFKVEKQSSIYSKLFGTLQYLSLQGDATYMILVPHHVIAVEVKDKEVYLIDNHTKQAIDASGSARLMQSVEAVYKIIKKDEPVFLGSYVEILDSKYQLTIDIHNTYKDPTDDTLIRRGLIQFKDMNELKEILDELQKLRLDLG